ncbi:allophanate hydrolase subunit 1 [Paracoccus cavernae]|uniref:5-oxoprolinase subunit B family protein n=2 Tax=Paracoccus cavernae TaxID=1571207 RepID=UPI0035F42A38
MNNDPMSIDPVLKPVAEHALLVDFPNPSDMAAAHHRVLALDAALTARPFAGLREAVPALTSLMVEFDPEVCDCTAAATAIRALLSRRDAPQRAIRSHEIAVCYDPPYAPDLAEVARLTGLAPEAVAQSHLAGDYHVALYGFAPGYAYLSGLPAPISLPRKAAALRDVPAGSVIIAAGQCLITTLTMPTGWWIIGRSPDPVLTGDPARPFRFEVGDRIRFRRIAASALGTASGERS